MTGNFAFGVSRPSDMLAKLKRELGRAASASFLAEDLVDHGVNCALTAWHVTDWVWKWRFVDNPEALAMLLAKYDDLVPIPPKKANCRFKEYLTRECPALALCQDVANGFKHVEARLPSKRQAAGVTEAAVTVKTAPPGPFTLGSSALGVDGLGGPGYEAGGSTNVLEILSTNGESWKAIDVFYEVAAFWTQFMAIHRTA